MIFHLQMGTVSYFDEFLPVPHITKDYSERFCPSPPVVFCSVLEQQMPFFFPSKA